MKEVDLDYTLEVNFKELFGTWENPLSKLLNSTYMSNVMKFIHEFYKSTGVPRPRQSEIFQVFRQVAFSEVKVVILTAEPLKNFKGNGVALATNEREYNSPSCITEMVERCVEDTVYNGINPSFDLTLEPWLMQGVFPLHASLTTTITAKDGYKNVWKEFTRSVLKVLSNSNKGIVFIFLGEDVKEYVSLINKKHNHVLEYQSPYESFKLKQDWACSCFSDTNKILKKAKGAGATIIW